MAAPENIVGVAGTGTDVGKTWVTAAVARTLRTRAVAVAARKPAQSFSIDDPPGDRDAAVLAASTGERADDVCLPHRSYEVPMAPPMAAVALGRPPIVLADLLAELRWPPRADVGFIETAGGVRSPIADDADNVALLRAVRPSTVLLVADAGLGTINLVRLSAEALAGMPVVVVLNRYDPADDLHLRNSAWLRERDGFTVCASIDDVVSALVGPSC